MVKLATDRMTNTELWTCLNRSLRWLMSSRPGEHTPRMKAGWASMANQCAEELQLRGEQLELPWDDIKAG
jgi:hypothetical protein